jgi:hypothetical protein
MRSGLISAALLMIPVVACPQSKPSVSVRSNFVSSTRPAAGLQNGTDRPSDATGLRGAATLGPEPANGEPFANQQRAVIPSLQDRLTAALRSASNSAPPHRTWNLQPTVRTDGEVCGHIIVYQVQTPEQFAAMGPQPRQPFPSNVPLENLDDAIHMHALPPCPQDIQHYGNAVLPRMPVTPR